MNAPDRIVRALGLCSGGLDSILSALVLREQGIDVTWVTFDTPFFPPAKAKKAARTHGISLITRDITPVYLEMLKDPPGGYGKNMNPCKDCHALMFRLAGEIMREEGYDFLFSGEVAGQRPMSQTKNSLRYVEKRSGFDGHILRPLSAKVLPETLPEKEGLVDRERLLGLSGRSRKPQIALAEKFGVKEYPSPAGGCLLTDGGFSKRLRDLFAHTDSVTKVDLNLLKNGRQFRLNPGAKLIMGRNRRDNEQIVRYAGEGDYLRIHCLDYPGPTGLLPKDADGKSIRQAAAILVGYTKAPAGAEVEVAVAGSQGESTVRVTGVAPAACKELLL